MRKINLKEKIKSHITAPVTSHKSFLIKHLTAILCFIFAFMMISIVSSKDEKKIPDINSYILWGGEDYAEVSCYTGKEESFSLDEIKKFEYELNKTIRENGKEETDSENKKWTDGYFGKGSTSVVNGSSSVDGTIYGVGGDFFAIHKLTLLSGGYIDTGSVMKDYIMLDEEAAWQLFGSNDVAGLAVTINGEKYVVSGVYKREDNRINNASGNGEITFYVNYEALEKIDETAEITGYEVIMQNPVKHYAYNYIYDFFKETDEQGKDNGREIYIVENSDRYSLEAVWKHFKNFGINAQDTDTIVYPYWENIAKAYDDIITLYFAFKLIICIIILAEAAYIIIKMYGWSEKIRKTPRTA